MPDTDNDQWGVGDQADAKAFDVTWLGGGPLLREDPFHELHLIHGQHPHSRSDNNTYARDPLDGEILPFNGHRRLLSVVVDESNYVKESELSGDEVRKTCTCRFFINGHVFHEIASRSAVQALHKAAQLLYGLGEGPESIYLEAIAAARPHDLINRPVYWRATPAIISHVIPEQGCLVLQADGVDAFPPDAHEIESGGINRDYSGSIKVQFNNPNIWWYRQVAAPHANGVNGTTATNSGRLTPQSLTMEQAIEKDA